MTDDYDEFKGHIAVPSYLFFKGCAIGVIVSVPIWVGVYMLTSWLIGR